MTPLRMGIGLLAMAALLGVAPAAAEEPGETLIPPGNSAVNQYTETVPTPRGDKDVDKDGKGNTNRSPEKVLGDRNAARLEEHGSTGRAAAQVAAETAPIPEETVAPVDEEESRAGGGGGGGGEPPRGNDGAGGDRHAPGSPISTGAENVSGSSGLGEVLAQATGTSSTGQVGALFPLLLFGALLWAVAYLWRQRRQSV